MGRGPLGHRPWSGPRAVNWAAGRGPPGRGPAFSKTRNSKPLVFEVLSRADVLRRSSHFSFISTSILYPLFIICI